MASSGAAIIPAMAAGYHNLKLIEDGVYFVVARVIAQLGVACGLLKW